MSLLSDLKAVFDKHHVEDELFFAGEGILRVADGGVYEDEDVRIQNNTGRYFFLVGVPENGSWKDFYKARVGIEAISPR